MTLLQTLHLVLDRKNLPESEAYAAMSEVMGGAAPTELISAFLVALRMKGETVEEITGFARAMREKSIRIQPHVSGRLVDTCGTGGAPVKTFNISTTAAFVAASAGVPVAKHGNRSVTRPSGSADILEALGVDLNLSPDQVRRVIERVGIGFLWAVNFHPAMKNAAPSRKALQTRTVFNILGPLTNPAGAQGQVLGVFDPTLVEPLAHVLARLGTEHALVLHGDGMDEACLHGVTRLAEVRDGAVRRLDVRGTDFGYPAADPQKYGPLTPAESAQEARRILAGGDGPRRQVVEFNAGLAIYVGGKANSIGNGILRARELLDSKSPLTKLDEFIAATRKPGG